MFPVTFPFGRLASPRDPIISHNEAFIGANTNDYTSDSLLKHVFLCFPTPK